MGTSRASVKKRQILSQSLAVHSSIESAARARVGVIHAKLIHPSQTPVIMNEWNVLAMGLSRSRRPPGLGQYDEPSLSFQGFCKQCVLGRVMVQAKSAGRHEGTSSAELAGSAWKSHHAHDSHQAGIRARSESVSSAAMRSCCSNWLLFNRCIGARPLSNGSSITPPP
jgi:hypothetical protein